MKIKIANPFRRDPAAVAARQQGRTERALGRQATRIAMRPLRNENRAAARAAGTSPGQILGLLHGQANMSAEKFFGVQDGGQNQLLSIFGGGSEGGPLGGLFGGGGGGGGGAAPQAAGMPGWVLPAAAAAVVLAVVVAVSR